MSIRPRHFRIGFAVAVIAALTVAVGGAIAYVTQVITGRASPLPTIPPWEWSGTDIAQWFSNRATSDSVLNVVTQVFATIAWLALIYVAYNVIRELIDQARHGVIDTRAPRTRQRSSNRRPRPSFASSFVAILLGASTLTASTVGAAGLPQRAPAVVAVDAALSTAADAEIADARPVVANPATSLPAGMAWSDYTATRADESLRSIATDVSGDAELAKFIWTANQHREVAPGTSFNDPTIVQPGWTLRIPVPIGSPSASPATTEAASDVQAPPAATHNDQVERGDTLYEMIDDVVDAPVTASHVEAVALENDGVATPDGTFVFSASNADLIHPGQVFNLQPAITIDTADTAATDGPVVSELPAPTAPEIVEAPAVETAPVDQSASDVDAGGGVVADSVDAPGSAGQPDRVRIDDVTADVVVDAAPVVADVAPPVPVVTSPPPPMPMPSNAIDAPIVQPGDSAATPPPPSAPAAIGNDRGDVPIMLLAAGGLGLAGLFIALDRRRRVARAKRPLGKAVAAADPSVQRDEQIMRAAAHIDRATRVNLAIRQLGAQLAQRDAPLRSRYIVADGSTVTVVFDHHVELADGWVPSPIDNGWTCDLSDQDLDAFAQSASPWPAIVPIGTLDDGSDIIVDVEGLGALAISGPDNAVAAVLSALVTSIASSPYADILTLVDGSNVGLHGLDAHLQHRLAVDSVDTLIERLGAWIAPFDFNDRHLISARHEFGGELEPCVAAIATDISGEHRQALAELPFDGSQPIALITTNTNVATTMFDLDADGTTIIDGQRVRCHRLEPAAAAAAATLFDTADLVEVSDANPLDDYRSVVEAVTEPADLEPDVDSHSADCDPSDVDTLDDAPALEVVQSSNGVPPVPAQLFDTEPDIGWHVQDLGPLEIVHTNGTHLRKMRELFALLAMHPAGLTALEVDDKLAQSQDPTTLTPSEDTATGDTAAADDSASSMSASGRRRFSDLRKALGQGDTIAGREYLPMHSKARGYHVEGIRVDSVRFVKCLEAAREASGHDKINWLVGALQLVRGQINTGEFTKYGWASRILSPLEASIVDVGIELAQLAADSGNWAVADWAASQVRVANPYDQRGLPIQVQARQALGDEVGIRRLHDEAIDTVDELEPDVNEVFIHALAQ